MKKSEIHFTVELDEQQIPEKIYWDATDNPNEGLSDTHAIAVSIWDHYHKGTLKIDLWTKDMEVPDMKRFIIEIISGLGSTAQDATGDEKMARDIEALCRSLTKHVDDEIKENNRREAGPAKP
jgi:gliding motility-associated protein GldC